MPKSKRIPILPRSHFQAIYSSSKRFGKQLKPLFQTSHLKISWSKSAISGILWQMIKRGFTMKWLVKTKFDTTGNSKCIIVLKQTKTSQMSQINRCTRWLSLSSWTLTQSQTISHNGENEDFQVCSMKGTTTWSASHTNNQSMTWESIRWWLMSPSSLTRLQCIATLLLTWSQKPHQWERAVSLIVLWGKRVSFRADRLIRITRIFVGVALRLLSVKCRWMSFHRRHSSHLISSHQSRKRHFLSKTVQNSSHQTYQPGEQVINQGVHRFYQWKEMMSWQGAQISSGR